MNKLKVNKTIFFVFVFITQIAFSQTENLFFGGCFKAGALKQNYFDLDHYSHLLNKPKNINFIIEVNINIGLRDKFFVSLSTFSSTSNKSGVFNNRDIQVSTNIWGYGLLMNYPLLKSQDFFIKRMFISLGAKHIESSFKSVTSTSTNLPFQRYENSKVSSLLISTGLNFELFNFELKNQKIPTRISLLYSIAYDFQIAKPSWSGYILRESGDENHKVNLGGFHTELGFSVWLGKINKEKRWKAK